MTKDKGNKMQTISVKLPVTTKGRNKPMKYIYWYYLKDRDYRVTGDIENIHHWQRKNLDASEAYILFINPLHNKKMSFMDKLTHKNELTVSVYHPFFDLDIIPYEKYINKSHKGDTSLEYTVTCYGKRKRWALVLIGNRGQMKLITIFRNIPRKYLRELDMSI